MNFTNKLITDQFSDSELLFLILEFNVVFEEVFPRDRSQRIKPGRQGTFA